MVRILRYITSLKKKLLSFCVFKMNALSLKTNKIIDILLLSKLSLNLLLSDSVFKKQN